MYKPLTIGIAAVTIQTGRSFLFNKLGPALIAEQARRDIIIDTSGNTYFLINNQGSCLGRRLDQLILVDDVYIPEEIIAPLLATSRIPKSLQILRLSSRKR